MGMLLYFLCRLCHNNSNEKKKHPAAATNIQEWSVEKGGWYAGRRALHAVVPRRRPAYAAKNNMVGVFCETTLWPIHTTFFVVVSCGS